MGGEGWMMKLICGSHNHELVKSFVGHSYAGRLTKAKCKILIGKKKCMGLCYGRSGEFGGLSF